MAAIDVIRRRLKEERIADVPEELGEKRKRPGLRRGAAKIGTSALTASRR